MPSNTAGTLLRKEREQIASGVDLGSLVVDSGNVLWRVNEFNCHVCIYIDIYETLNIT